MSKVDDFGNSSVFRNIQNQVRGIRESLDVIEGNLIDYVDSNLSETDKGDLK